MRLLATRPVPAGTAGICRADVELDGGIRLFNLTVKRAAHGGLCCWAPHAFGTLAVTLPASLGHAIAEIAVTEFNRSIRQHDRSPAG